LYKSNVAAIVSVFFALVMTNLTLAVVLFFIPNFSYGRISLIYTIWIQLFLISMWKVILKFFLTDKIMKRALIYGQKTECEIIAKKLLNSHQDNVKVVYIHTDEHKIDKERFKEMLSEVNRVYITSSTHEKAKNWIINYCLGKKFIDTVLVPKTYEISILNASPIQVEDILSLRIYSFHLSFEQRIIKRTFDVIVSLIALIVLSPLMITIALIIKLHDKGPVLFVQERVTYENKSFKIYKFRSMIPNAEKDTGAVQASENDSRITPIGKVLRATRIDELPQFINVLKGQMSIVGPRALRIEEVNQFEEQDSHFKFRAKVKAGITGLAQTLGKYDTTFDDKLRLDLLYMRNYSFVKDLAIIFDTIKVVFDRESSRGVQEDFLFEEFVKYHGFKLEQVADDCVKLKNIV
jgi:exopolysaccharide biosynthesis polyprenyl glycosylphosphotransferase